MPPPPPPPRKFSLIALCFALSLATLLFAAPISAQTPVAPTATAIPPTATPAPLDCPTIPVATQPNSYPGRLRFSDGTWATLLIKNQDGYPTYVPNSFYCSSSGVTYRITTPWQHPVRTVEFVKGSEYRSGSWVVSAAPYSDLHYSATNLPLPTVTLAWGDFETIGVTLYKDENGLPAFKNLSGTGIEGYEYLDHNGPPNHLRVLNFTRGNEQISLQWQLKSHNQQLYAQFTHMYDPDGALLPPTSTPTATPVPSTPTPVPPTATPVPPTATEAPPSVIEFSMAHGESKTIDLSQLGAGLSWSATIKTWHVGVAGMPQRAFGSAGAQQAQRQH